MTVSTIVSLVDYVNQVDWGADKIVHIMNTQKHKLVILIMWRHQAGLNQFLRNLIHFRLKKCPPIPDNRAQGHVLAVGVNQSSTE